MYISIFSIILFNNISKIFASKYCSLESNGEPKYYICARNEYCCHFGCCVHLAFQFYQLWYYWLLLIFMFMICSGGSWWYKFCRQNETSNYASTVTSYERCTGRHVSAANARRSRNTYERNNIDGTSAHYFQRLWKENSTTPPPNYYTASVVRYHSASELETRRQYQECPYHQLYGPPPSYESVIRIPENGCGPPSCTLIASSTSNFVNNSSNSNNVNDNRSISAPSSSSFQIQARQSHQQTVKQNINQFPSTSMQANYHHEHNENVDDDDDDDGNDHTSPCTSQNAVVQSFPENASELQKSDNKTIKDLQQQSSSNNHQRHTTQILPSSPLTATIAAAKSVYASSSNSNANTHGNNFVFASLSSQSSATAPSNYVHRITATTILETAPPIIDADHSNSERQHNNSNIEGGGTQV